MTREWKLPKPNLKEYDFQPVVRLGNIRHVPFGYEVDPEDEDILLPIEHELIALERAKELLKEYTYREVADWLTRETGRAINHSGLWKRIKIEQKRKTKASIARFYAQRYKEAWAKAEEIEKRIGARDPVKD